MRKALRLNDWSVKQAIESRPELAGKKPIGRGLFSAIYEGTKPGRVLKVTVDDIGYWMLNDRCVGLSGKHFPKLYQNFGVIGEIKRGGSAFPIYMFEVERLEPLAAGSDARKIARATGNASYRASLIAGGSRANCYDVLCELKVPGVARSVRRALSALRDFASYFSHGTLDMHMGNFMQRKDGTLVITDPIANMGIHRKLVANRYW